LTQTNPIARTPIILEVPGLDDVIVRREEVYAEDEGNALTMDIYYPPNRVVSGRAPVVVIAAGYPDPGFERIVGCKFKNMSSVMSWAKSIAVSGMAAITYTNCVPAADLQRLLQYVRQNSIGLELDENRVGLWASSGNAPLALSVVTRQNSPWLKCAAICYGYLLDSPGSKRVSDIGDRFGFVTPTPARVVADLPTDIALFIARAGHDEMPYLNDTLDRFVAEALAANLPLTVANHPSGPHAFDLFDRSRMSQVVIQSILTFLRLHLVPAAATDATR
jgi:hypothetical protein